MPTIPTCHRTLAPDPHPRYLYDRRRISEAEIVKIAAAQPNEVVAVSEPAAITRLGGGCPCIGSGCALWVPEVKERHGRVPMSSGLTNGELTNRGWCADNLRRASFADPAPREPHPEAK